MNIGLLIRLLLAHFIGDFALQTNRIYNGKKAGGTTAIIFLFIHSGIHAALVFGLSGLWGNWILPLVILTTHFVIDFLKYRYLDERLFCFLIDQAFHIAVIIVSWLFVCEMPSKVITFIGQMAADWRLWLCLLGYVLVMKPTSVVLSITIKRWQLYTSNKASLPDAGKWIGYLERILILTFIFTNHAEGIGFLLAAKSVFRFGELNKRQEIRTTEYVIVGTLLSFAVAILIGFTIIAVR